MGKGGPRIRAGRPVDPTSGRSEKRGVAAISSATALPAEGHKGRPPAFPLPRITRGSAAASKAFRAREVAIWRAAWRTPQATVWVRDSWRWQTIAEYCRVKAAVELAPDANGALVSRLREYRTEIGLSPDGLKVNGWLIAYNQVAEHAAKHDDQPPARSGRRLRAVPAQDPDRSGDATGQGVQGPVADQ